MSSKKLSDNSSKTTLESVLSDSIAKLKAAGVDAPRTDALVLLETVLNKDRTWILSHGEVVLSTDNVSAFLPLLEKRLKRTPLAYVIGFKEFYGNRFEVDQNVLIPRPETEVMVEFIVKNAPKNAKILDMGTGSGAIAVSVAKERPDVSVTASDISKDVLDVASHNSSNHGTNIKFVHSNLLDSIQNRFDHITANLPYVPTTTSVEPEINHEPSLALYADSDGLSLYRTLFAHVERALTPHGVLTIEHLPEQYSPLREIASKNDYQLSSLTSFVSTTAELL